MENERIFIHIQGEITIKLSEIIKSHLQRLGYNIVLDIEQATILCTSRSTYSSVILSRWHNLQIIDLEYFQKLIKDKISPRVHVPFEKHLIFEPRNGRKRLSLPAWKTIPNVVISDDFPAKYARDAKALIELCRNLDYEEKRLLKRIPKKYVKRARAMSSLPIINIDWQPH